MCVVYCICSPRNRLNDFTQIPNLLQTIVSTIEKAEYLFVKRWKVYTIDCCYKLSKYDVRGRISFVDPTFLSTIATGRSVGSHKCLHSRTWTMNINLLTSPTRQKKKKTEIHWELICQSALDAYQNTGDYFYLYHPLIWYPFIHSFHEGGNKYRDIDMILLVLFLFCYIDKSQRQSLRAVNK